MFVRNNGVWSERAKLNATDGVDGDNFGMRLDRRRYGCYWR